MTEDKKQYYEKLRERWNSAKRELTEKRINEIQAIIATHGLSISYMGYAFCAIQMKKLNLDGIPYLDCKTYKGWKENGYQVRKGEHSSISGITWIPVVNGHKVKADENYRDDDIEYMLPKEYRLFHKSQVDAAA